MKLRIAHSSDLHLPLPAVRWHFLLSKRLLGYLSWHRKRKYHHTAQIAKALLEDLREQAFDHLCITGDLTNLGLKAEVDHAAEWLEALAPAERISIVPGNHDMYVGSAASYITKRWHPWMQNFPYVHHCGDVAIIGVSSAIPTAPFLASGAIGKKQLAKLEPLLNDLGKQGKCRIVILHHPPQAGLVSHRKRLRDAAAFRAVMARAGCELVLHGHAHHDAEALLQGADGCAVPVWGVGTGTAGGASDHYRGHYQWLEIERRNHGWHIARHHRRYDRTTGTFIASEN